MENASIWGDRVAALLSEAASRLPDGFFCSFDYTTTGQNFCHPIAWGALVRGIPMDDHTWVGIDVRLNDRAGAKFQPDIVLFDRSFNPIVCIDYESPNSSDSRVPFKDIDAFLAYKDAVASGCAYVVVTTLPDVARPSWEIRYTAAGQWNEGLRPHAAAIRDNPFRFWETKYKAAFERIVDGNLAWVNLDQKHARRIFPK